MTILLFNLTVFGEFWSILHILSYLNTSDTYIFDQFFKYLPFYVLNVVVFSFFCLLSLFILFSTSYRLVTGRSVRGCRFVGDR